MLAILKIPPSLFENYFFHGFFFQYKIEKIVSLVSDKLNLY